VLPGGRPRPGESLGSCARREAYEETGLRVHPHRVGLVGEVAGRGRERIVELIFVGLLDLHDQEPTRAEGGTEPGWVRVADLPGINLRPPIAGYLPALAQGRLHTAAYLGNLWRPPPEGESAPPAATGEVWPT
jgi:ADP-ribose pyrophosphatase YjhB (NUDIX family)